MFRTDDTSRTICSSTEQRRPYEPTSEAASGEEMSGHSGGRNGGATASVSPEQRICLASNGSRNHLNFLACKKGDKIYLWVGGIIVMI